MYYSEEKYLAFLSILKEISNQNSKANILVLGRNNKDIESILAGKRIYIDYSKLNEDKCFIKTTDYPELSITYNTVHGSKGLEEDYAIIINADDSRYGFPNKMEDDELLNMVLSSKSGFEYAEERRLWYVALTRTRNYTYIIANAACPSIFVQEIEDKCKIMDNDTIEKTDESLNCPACKSGRLVYRTGNKNGKFYGCSNYPYCNYTIDDFDALDRNKRCRFCGDFMVLKKGKYGIFYGCHNYPRCIHKEKINNY